MEIEQNAWLHYVPLLFPIPFASNHTVSSWFGLNAFPWVETNFVCEERNLKTLIGCAVYEFTNYKLKIHVFSLVMNYVRGFKLL